MDARMGTTCLVFDPSKGSMVRVKVGALRRGHVFDPSKGSGAMGVGCGSCPVWRDVQPEGRCNGCPK